MLTHCRYDQGCKDFPKIAEATSKFETPEGKHEKRYILPPGVNKIAVNIYIKNKIHREVGRNKDLSAPRHIAS